MPRRLAVLVVALACAACSAPAPAALTPSAAARPASTATPRPEQIAPLNLVLLQVDETPVPPAEPTPPGAGVGRPTATPYATAAAGFKYVTFTFAVENHSDTPRLVGIGGPDPRHTNLADATLVARDGTRFRPFQSYSSFGLRTASARSLNTYPVLLRLPPGLRATGESYGALTTNFAQRSSVSYRVPSTTSDFVSLTIPALSVGPRSGEDETAKRLRSLVGAIQPLDLSGVHVGATGAALGVSPTQVSTAPGLVSVSLVGSDLADPGDFQARNHGWKVLTVGLRYRNDDATSARALSVAAWVFGDDGIVYSGDVPALGDFGRATSAPEPSVIAAWDGRTAAPDQLGPGQEQETRRAEFQVPATLRGGLLVLAGDVEATFRLESLT